MPKCPPHNRHHHFFFECASKKFLAKRERKRENSSGSLLIITSHVRLLSCNNRYVRAWVFDSCEYQTNPQSELKFIFRTLHTHTQQVPACIGIWQWSKCRHACAIHGSLKCYTILISAHTSLFAFVSIFITSSLLLFFLFHFLWRGRGSYLCGSAICSG